MTFPGKNKLIFSTETIRIAIESAINNWRKDGEDYLYVTSLHERFGEWTVEFTTDAPNVEEERREAA